MKFSDSKKELAMVLWRVVNEVKNSIKANASITEVREEMQRIPEAVNALANAVNVVMPVHSINVDVERLEKEGKQKDITIDQLHTQINALKKLNKEMRRKIPNVIAKTGVKTVPVATHPRANAGQSGRKAVKQALRRILGR
jgi:seryl-tRNA synthetase